MNSERKKVAIVMPVRNEMRAFSGLSPLHDEILASVPDKYNPKVYVAVANSSSHFLHHIKNIESHNQRVKLIDLNTGAPGLASVYLQGLREAVKDGADFIIEMDGTGAHKPTYIKDFLEVLDRKDGKKVDVAFSSRFSKNGGIEGYPLQRKVISMFGTLAANLFLDLGQWIPDMTSGYEGFSRRALEDVLTTIPIETWISVIRGPGHFYQTEMRAYMIWKGFGFDIVPIIWGAGRIEKPKDLPQKTLLKALEDLFILRRRKEIVKHSK